MRIYDGDFTVRNILEGCRRKPHRATPLNFDGPADTPEIDLERLNDRLAGLPVEEIRRRRARMNTFYEEVLVSADPDRGIEFNGLLMILAHYKVINDNKSLRLEEFLRRRARLQRVDEAVRRNIVVGFFDTLYWSRKFRRRIDARKSARMTAVPSHDFEVPEIYVQDESDTPAQDHQGGITPITPVDRPSFDGQEYFNVVGSRATAISGSDAGSSPGSQRTVLRNRSDSIQFSPSGSPTRPIFHSPALSTASAREDWAAATAGGGGMRQRPSSPGHLGSGVGPDGMHGGRSRASSAVSAQEVLDVLDNSAWGESIRRSFTLRRPGDEVDDQGDPTGGRGSRSSPSHRRVS